MSKPNENESRFFQHSNSSLGSLPVASTTLRPLVPRPRPPDEHILNRISLSPSPATSIESSSRGSPLYMRSSTRSQSETPSPSSRKRNRRSRQSLSTINNQSSPSADDVENASHKLAREKLAWKVINREIAEWQNVCHTGRPSWWSPTTRWTRRLRSQSSINRDMSRFGEPPSEWVDEGEDPYYPGLCFEYERRRDAAKDGNRWLHELAFLIAVQLLSACFTLPVDQFPAYRAGIRPTYDGYGFPEMPDEKLISSLRMHTNYRWSPAFGHEARTTSPEAQRSTSYSVNPPTPHMTPGGVQSSPDVNDSSLRFKTKKQHRARHVTPAETEHQDFWEDTYENSYGFQSPLRTPTIGSWRDGSWRDRRNLARSASYISVPGRVVQSAPPTPLRTYKAASLSKHVAEREHLEEYPFPVTNAPVTTQRGRYSLQLHLRSEPHPVFVQPVRELVGRRWRAFRRRFGYSLSHGNPDQILNSTNAAFTDEFTVSTWSPATPPSNPPPRGVRRRRDARSRHDIHSSSMESSPRYNTPTSGTMSGRTSGMTSPGLPCAAPQSTPMAGEVDDLIATARAITNSSSAIPQEPLTASQPFPVFTPNNTPDYTEAEAPGPIRRNEAGYFTQSRDSSTGSAPSFVPKAKSKVKRRSSARGSRRSRLSEVFTQDEVAEEGRYQPIQAQKRNVLTTEHHSTLTTPTEESDSDGSKSRRRRQRDALMSDTPAPSMPSPMRSSITRVDSPKNQSPPLGNSRNETVLSPPISPLPSSVTSVDTDPFAFLSPRRDSQDVAAGRSLAISPRPRRPSLGRMPRNESPITQMRDSPPSLSRINSWGSRLSFSRHETYSAPSVQTTSRSDSRSPSYVDSPPGVNGSEAMRQSLPSYPRSHVLPSSMSRGDSRSSTASASNRNNPNPLLRGYPQPALPSLVRGDSRSSTASSSRPDLSRAVTSFPNVRPSMDRAALSWTNTPNNSEDGGRRASWQSHRSASSNDEAYDPHAVDCHSNLPSERGNSPAPGSLRGSKTEPLERRDAREERARERSRLETVRSHSVGARPAVVRRSISTPVVRPLVEEPEGDEHGWQEELKAGMGRNRLSRVSSSGTTHFTSGPEGAEVDGLPVGPDKEAWDEVGELYSRRIGEGLLRLGSMGRSGRRKKARSFL